MSKVIRSERLVSVDVLANSNKVWIGSVYDDGTLVAEWGRVGGTMQSKSFPYGSVETANAEMDKKISQKLKPKTDSKGMVTQYERVDVVENINGHQSQSPVSGHKLETIAAKQIKHSNDPIVDDLIRRLARENVHNIISATGGKLAFDDTTGLFSTPVGIVTQAMIDDARSILAGLIPFVKSGQFYDDEFVKGLQMYMRRIPQDLGYDKITPDLVLPSMQAVDKQNDILQSLEASLQMAADRATATDQQPPDEPEEPKVFDVKLELVESNKKRSELRRFYHQTRKQSHVCSHLDVKQAFKIHISLMADAFTKRGAPIGNIVQLWHGTRTSNLLSILKQGLMIPPASSAHCTGRLFGNGLYFAPSSTKSLNYAYGYWDGKARDEKCFMFIADVAMGKPHVPSRNGSKTIPHGFDSIWAKGNQSGVINDECIVPHVYQCNLVYLLEFSPGGN